MRGILVLFLVLGFWGCSKTEPQGTLSPALKTSEIEQKTKGTKFFEGTYEDHWEKFKSAMVANDPNWDWLKFVENPEMKGREHEYGDVFKDDFALGVLKDTSYESLNVVEKGGQTYREFPVVSVDAEGTPQGTVYIFHESSYGLVLSGERPF